MRNVQLIVPAAGYGIRVGRPLAKEMLPHPKTGNPLIVTSLEVAKNFNYSYHLITREEKTNLIAFVKAYCEKHSIPLTIQEISPKGEWPQTVLSSSDFWHEKNILILPDSEFSPLNSVLRIEDSLNSNEIVLATFKVDDPKNWGCVRNISEATFEICEKPQEPSLDSIQINISKSEEEQFLAWGLIGFKNEIGKELFQNLEDSNKSHLWKRLNFKCKKVTLDLYIDLTR